MGRKIKYMGTADIRTIPKGANFGGQLPDGTEKEVVFNKDNFWVVDAEEAGLSDEAVDLLLEDEGFKDVSDHKRVPPNAFQSTFLGMKSVSEEEANVVTQAASATSDTGTTTGGSTTGTDTAGGSTTKSTGRTTKST